VGVSDIVAELARVQAAFEKPTLRLLARKQAPLVLAVFRSTFTRDQPSVPAERLHARIDHLLVELGLTGATVPDMSGRVLCGRWLGQNWLVRSLDEAGGEHYSLTSHALEALDLVQTLARERTLISESRIYTILDVVRRFATAADPDRETRIERLNARIAELTAERDRLEAGGGIEAASDEEMLDGYTNLLSLIGQLPGDFKRVEESFAAMHRKIISDFRIETRPIAEVIDEYLATSDSLMTLTPEGRAFEGAFELLRDAPLLRDLRRDLDVIMTHPFARNLTSSEQREFRRTVTVIRNGIRDVLAQRQRLSATLRAHIVGHDVARDRELDAVLRRIDEQLELWMATAGPRATIGAEVIPVKIDLEYLLERLWDPADASAPPPLEDVTPAAPPGPAIDAIRGQGGPSLGRLRREIAAALADGGDRSVGDVFAGLPDELRRPVELLGLLHLVAAATGAETDDKAASPEPAGVETPVADAARAEPSAHSPALPAVRSDGEELVETLRPDGSRRLFMLPIVPLGSAGLELLAEGVDL
jgi:hypothetical protein